MASVLFDHISTLDQHISQVDGQLHILEKQVAGLRMQSQKLHSKRRRLAGQTPWVSRLSNATLSRIMFWGIQSHICSRETKGLGRVMFPIAVSQVNKTWRHVARDESPFLWSYINMGEGRPYDRTIVWLKRSEPAPLDIDLDFRHEPEENLNHRTFLVALNLVLPHLSRWNTFSIRAPSELMQTAVSLLSAPAPHLKSLILRGYGESTDEETSDRPPPIFQSHTPKLRLLHLHDIGLAWSTCRFSVLVDLNLSWVPGWLKANAEQLSAVLNSCSRTLRRFSITGTGLVIPTKGLLSSVMARVSTFRVYLPALEELWIDGLDEARDLFALLALLETPNLRRLALARLDGDDGGSKALRHSSFDSLDHLTFVDVGTSLFQLFAAFSPNVTKLDIQGIDVDGKLVYLTAEPLLMMPGEEMVCPNIEELNVNRATIGTVHAFVRNRTGTLRLIQGTINDLPTDTSQEQVLEQLGFNTDGVGSEPLINVIKA